MKRKKLEPITGVEPALEKTTTSLVKPQRHSSSSTIAFKEIPLCSIYYRLFENFENRQVPSNTTPYDQISMLSPQTPRNIRRCVLGKCFMSNHAYHHKSLNLEILYNEFNFDMFPRSRPN